MLVEGRGVAYYKQCEDIKNPLFKSTTGNDMTSLIAWVGVDSRGPASFYLASDSRISWDNRGTWDFARKVFASDNHPDLLGYYGEVLFSSQVLSQIIDLIDLGSLFEQEATPESKFQAVSAVLREAHSTYPQISPQMAQEPFTVVHCSRRRDGMTTSFALFELSWEPIRGWRSNSLPVRSDQSGIVAAYGSGAQNMLASIERWDKSEVGRTSRSVFSAFCDSLASGADPASGGAPQLVGIYRKGAAESFGVIYKGKRYLHGLCVEGSPFLGGVEWRNELFERCDWNTGERLEGAQRHTRPRHLDAV